MTQGLQHTVHTYIYIYIGYTKVNYIWMCIFLYHGILFLDWNLGIVVFGKTKQNVEIYQEKNMESQEN